jgi:hypothetical protein
MRTPVALLSLVLISGAALAQVASSEPPAPTPAADAKDGAVTLVAGKKGKRARHQMAATKPGAIKPGAATEAEAPKQGGPPDPLTSCLELWDPATHMTRREWDRACRRVAERLKASTLR